MSDRTQRQQRNRHSPEALPCYMWEEIGAHNRRSDCWIVIDDFVYDVTSWVDRHPGGDIICSMAVNGNPTV
jgi:fatty acid desaturase 2 (delta-6 desaturase)